jgi:stress response protein SCP2
VVVKLELAITLVHECAAVQLHSKQRLGMEPDTSILQLKTSQRLFMREDLTYFNSLNSKSSTIVEVAAGLSSC